MSIVFDTNFKIFERAIFADCFWIEILLPFRWYVFIFFILLFEAIPITIVPTGLFFVPPFGPTALALLVLERYKGGKSFFQCLKTLNFDGSIMKIFWDLLKDSDIRNYVFKNFLFEVPGINKKLFVQDAQKIVPSLSVDDIEYAKGFGGVRPQVLNKTEKKLMLGEASITEEKGIIYNMTPSPGATSCLGNAERDIKIVCEYLGKKFNEEQFLADFTDDK